MSLRVFVQVITHLVGCVGNHLGDGLPGRCFVFEPVPHNQEFDGVCVTHSPRQEPQELAYSELAKVMLGQACKLGRAHEVLAGESQCAGPIHGFGLDCVRVTQQPDQG